VFVAYLNDEHEKHGHYIEHAEQFLDECRQGLCCIYTSAMTIAEIPANRLKSTEYGTFNDFLDDYNGSIIQIGADPVVMTLAAHIRGLIYTKQGGKREVGTPDAIHLASALVLTAEYHVPLTAFHTFDNGKNKGLEGGKAVSLLAYETWCESCRDDPVAKRIIAMARTKPIHPNPRLPLLGNGAMRAAEAAISRPTHSGSPPGGTVEASLDPRAGQDSGR
jgi:predicted nucleic acid-binding protein